MVAKHCADVNTKLPFSDVFSLMARLINHLRSPLPSLALFYDNRQ